jgi:ABC-type glycerol-3-phosphate transport system permease component
MVSGSVLARQRARAVVSTIVSPFFHRYFIHGIRLGAVKG